MNIAILDSNFALFVWILLLLFIAVTKCEIILIDLTMISFKDIRF